MDIRSISFRKLIFICLIVFSIIPDIGVKYSIAGFTWTAYRTMILISVMAVGISTRMFELRFGSALSRWICFMAFWALYGLILLFVGKYSDLHKGFVEWLSVFNGLIVMYMMSLYLRSEEERDTAVTLIYWLLNLMVLIGIFEILTGHHWITSAYSDANSSISQYTNARMATGLMYNMNDFSAMITCMSPVLLYEKLGKKRVITLLGVLFINLRNDATTCTVAMILFVLFYLLILKSGDTQRLFFLKIFLLIAFVAGVCIIVLFWTTLSSKVGFLGAIARQLDNGQRSMGSLYKRFLMYYDALKAFVSTGMLGMGPYGFSAFFSLNPSRSGLINPHSLFLEILTQYGIFVFAGFVYLLIMMFLSGKKMYETADKSDRSNGLMVVAFVMIYAIASFAPSTFIGYSYQWLMIAVMSSLLYTPINDHNLEE